VTFIRRLLNYCWSIFLLFEYIATLAWSGAHQERNESRGESAMVLDTCFVANLYSKYGDGLRSARENQRELYRNYLQDELLLKDLLFYIWYSWSASKYFAATGATIGLLLRSKGYWMHSKLDTSKSTTNRRAMALSLLRPQLDDIEAEVTYLLIREFRPKTIVEIAPSGGWSTSWILRALKDNNYGTLYSYDYKDASTKVLPSDLTADRWIFTKGKIQKRMHKLPQAFDYLFMDADHSDSFASWYVQHLFPRLKDGALVSVHDVFHKSQTGFPYEEGTIVLQWLQQKKYQFVTFSPARDRAAYNKIIAVKKELMIDEEILTSQANPMIFFRTE
jgi:predicted O-methyltransferase YrrM